MPSGTNLHPLNAFCPIFFYALRDYHVFQLRASLISRFFDFFDTHRLVILLSEPQFIKASFPVLTTVLGISMRLSRLYPKNVPGAMYVIPSGLDNPVRFLL